MSVRMKLLPAVITLLAGAVTSIMTFCFHYEGKTALLILSVVLLLFYILGLILQRVILAFEHKNAKEKAKEEGKVVEKRKEKSEEVSSQKSENRDNTVQNGQNMTDKQDNVKEAPTQENTKEADTQESQN